MPVIDCHWRRGARDPFPGPLRSLLGSQPQHCVLPRPFGQCVAEARDAGAPRQSTVGSGLHKGWWKASEILMLTCRTLHFSRAAICSTSATTPATMSSSQRLPQAIDVTSERRVSERIGRVSSPAGAIISRRRLIRLFFQGTWRTPLSDFLLALRSPLLVSLIRIERHVLRSCRHLC